jgi:NSS family neurotransmitter:Na+ symporter
MAVQREVFGTKAGFILAAAGSAVGLGNMWRFSYQASEGGGAAFVLIYIGLTLTLGLPLLLAEFSLGRKAQLGPIGALRAAAGEHWSKLGYVFTLAGLLILAYYSVIAGWTLRYALESLTTGFPQDAGAHFGAIATGPAAIGFHLAFMLATVLIVMGGVRAGIERAALVLMPMLFLLIVGLAIWATGLPDSAGGYAKYLRPDLAELTNPSVWRAAAAQSFFSLSLGMGCMLTFASYLSREGNLPEAGTIVAFTDFSVAFIAGLVVFPVIFSFGLQSAVGASTVGALFIALPTAFEAMGSLGRVVGFAFFVALAVGAITSAISLLEVVITWLMDEWQITRRRAALGSGLFIAALGILPALDTDTLGIMDKIAGELLLVFGSLMIAILVGWRVRSSMLEELRLGATPRWQAITPALLSVLRWFVPPVVGIVLIYSAIETYSALRDYFGQ